MSTIKDIAKHTGLSLATISKYLNGGNVLAENREKIDEAIELLHYRINRSARSLRSNHTKTVGVVMPTMALAFFGSVFSELDSVLTREGYTEIACSYNFNRELEVDKFRYFASNNVDGIVLIPQFLTAGEIDSIYSSVGRSFPIVLVDRTIPDFKCDTIVIDNLNAAYTSVEHLINQGHRRIGIIVGPQNISTAYERAVGYYRALKDYGLLDADYSSLAESRTENELVRIGNYDFESGFRIFNEFMDMDNPPTALCATNYDMTLGAISAARERRIVLGESIGFVGFDALNVCGMIRPQLCVVEQPTSDMGRCAGELLLKRMKGDSDGFPKVIRLKTQLHLENEY